ncbi:Alanine racemase [Sphingomonas sp. EC-HK361]|uniref:alanine racemase n=1 Tax=Sphingomonas sp. EC-HK361 TaxID=2038397 RepID=UPI001254282F|nr:alanine racemase [Sphingomonas sp. EC-HK361]VVT04992.1 Alanine racemase [Sphingomonas sp. EC-HK361]
MSSPNRLRIDRAALAQNWRTLDRMSGAAACGAAVKADGYGLGARLVVETLAAAGARDFFVATWAEARAIADMGVSIAVLHGIRAEDLAEGLPANARPVLNTAGQVALWRDAGAGRPCDLMVDTGMNRLGLDVGQAVGEQCVGLTIDTLMSHLACADEDSAMNAAQRERFAALAGQTTARRMSLANSAGIALGRDYAFDLTRPGLALYGGVPRAELADSILQVVMPEAQVIQRRVVRASETVGYNALWRAEADTEIAILNIGYADGYWRGFTNSGAFRWGDVRLPVLGRVSMDLTAVDLTDATNVREGDWIAADYALASAAAASGMSQYELLTGLGQRFERM